jgi:mono/diheme cytochrome c family protein
VRLLAMVLATLVAEAVIGVAVLETGILAVSADQTPSFVEERLLSLALRSSVARAAARGPSSPPATPEALANGAEIYGDLCARCHGDARTATPSTLGRAFYPPAPPLPGHVTRWSEAELRWIIQHGVRNTGMPAWGALLSANDIHDVAALVKAFSTAKPGS